MFSNSINNDKLNQYNESFSKKMGIIIITIIIIPIIILIIEDALQEAIENTNMDIDDSLEQLDGFVIR